MTLIIKEQNTIDTWENLLRDFLITQRGLKEKEQIDSVIEQAKELLEEKERIAFCAFIDNKPCGFINGMIERGVMEESSFYVLPESFSENCGYKLISALTTKAFKMDIKYFRFGEALPFNKEPTFEDNLVKDDYAIFPRVQMILDLSSEIDASFALPKGYSFRAFSKENIDEMIEVVMAANPKTHCDSKIHPEFLIKETTRKIFSGENDFDDYKPELNPELIFENNIVGVGFVVNPQEDFAFIAEICIHPKHQGKGLGKSFMKKIIQACKEKGIKKLGLAVTKENIGAYTLYEKLGFKVTKEYLTIIKHKK